MKIGNIMGVGKKGSSVRVSLLRFAARPVFGAFVLGVVFPVCASAAELQPHRAIYDLQLDESHMSSDISDLTGRLLIEWTGNACLGYELQQRLMMRITTADGYQAVRDLRFEGKETGDGSGFEFDFRRLMDGEEMERIHGAGSTEDTPSVFFFEPHVDELSLPGNIHFPTRFALSLIGAAEAGLRTFSQPVYEGADIDTYFLASAFIGGVSGKDAGLSGVAMDGDVLEDMEARDWWSVQLSYHRPDSADGLPEYQVSYHLYANGVTSALKMDYTDFKVDGTLKQLDYLPSEPCEP